MALRIILIISVLLLLGGSSKNENPNPPNLDFLVEALEYLDHAGVINESTKNTLFDLGFEQSERRLSLYELKMDHPEAIMPYSAAKIEINNLPHFKTNIFLYLDIEFLRNYNNDLIGQLQKGYKKIRVDSSWITNGKEVVPHIIFGKPSTLAKIEFWQSENFVFYNFYME